MKLSSTTNFAQVADLIKHHRPNPNPTTTVKVNKTDSINNYIIAEEGPENALAFNSFKGRNIPTTYSSGSIVGMKKYGIASSPLDINKPFAEQTYKYGEFTKTDDINAFLDQVDRLDGELQTMFQHLKPTPELFDLVQKMSDEELVKFTEFMVASSRHYIGMDNKNISEQLISSLSKQSADEFSSTLETMSTLLQQGNDYTKPVSPVGENKNGHEIVEMISKPDNVNWFKSNYGSNVAKYELVIDYANLLIDKNLSEEQLIQVNDHLSQSNLEQSSSIIDMMSLLKAHQNDDVLAMISEVDKDSELNLLSYLAQQTNYQANKQYYQMGNGKFVAQQDNISSDSNRRELYDTILNAYDTIGMGWINDTLDQFTGTPAQVQNELWQTLLDDKESRPEQFINSDSVATWAKNNISQIEGVFHIEQMNKIFAYNSERLVPDLIDKLTFYSSGNIYSKTNTEKLQSD
ncbi:hypothetical protein [Pseudoalteromonas atlantica]|uniref:hypothetical protein n=1 Tax=Pseudoalteromonas atlantica TaxID=288 RepID=UPI003735B71B